MKSLEIQHQTNRKLYHIINLTNVHRYLMVPVSCVLLLTVLLWRETGNESSLRILVLPGYKSRITPIVQGEEI